MRRFYFSTLAGNGAHDNPFRPTAFDLVSSPSGGWSAQDGRADQTSAAGLMLVWADVTGAEHTTLTADPGIAYVPFEDGSGNVLATSAAIGDIEATKRQTMANQLEARHVPTDGLNLSDTIYTAVRRVMARYRIRQYLLANDYTEGLDTTVASIPAPKRQAIKAALEALGFDLSAVTGSWTIRQVLVELARQDGLIRR